MLGSDSTLSLIGRIASLIGTAGRYMKPKPTVVSQGTQTATTPQEEGVIDASVRASLSDMLAHGLEEAERFADTHAATLTSTSTRTNSDI